MNTETQHDTQAAGEVALAAQHSASSVFHALLSGAARRYSSLAFADLPVDALRRDYADLLVRFEVARLADAQRDAIADAMLADLAQYIVWRQGDAEQPLKEHLRAQAAPPTLERRAFAGTPGWLPGMIYRGRRWQGEELPLLATELHDRGVVSYAAMQSLHGIGERLGGNALDLSGRRIALLGANAEMAPTRLWLRAGAEVLWLDVAPPPADWLRDEQLAGTLVWPVQPIDLLRAPQEALAALRSFADGGAVDIGLYAYAPGRARELRLTATMNALVDAMPRASIASVTMLVSPTTPTRLPTKDVERMRTRLAQRPAWEAALARFGLLGRGGGSFSSATPGETDAPPVHATRTVVPIQGLSYQAAQYIGKVLAAERWAAQGLRVSANTAAITRTRSLDHPVFAAAFGGAAAFGVETLTPRQSRRLNGLLAVADWLAVRNPVPGEVRVHGALHGLPYPLEKALRIAAAIGFLRSPGLLKGLLRR